ncbi:MAG: hypothetical protein GYB35_16340, partial [Algicola sp.]|nr:hypothetical protein [Algicola sp.]
LMGDAPDNLTDIDTKPNTYPKITEDLNAPNTNQRIDNQLIINNKFTSVGGDFDFSYQLPNTVFTDCLTKDCVYDVTIKVLDEYGNELLKKTETASKNTVINFSINLEIGSYQIIKILELNETNLNEIVEEFIDLNLDDNNPNRCYKPEIIDPIGCDLDCEEACKSQYITPENNGVSLLYNDNGRIIGERVNGNDTVYDSSDQNDYDSIYGSGGKIEQCISDCESNDYTDLKDLPNECDIKYELLKTDMSKGGQYFDNLPDFDPSSYNKNEWLNNLTNISLADRSTIINCLGIKTETTTNNLWDYMRANWQPEWGDIMIQYHPEYCLFQQTCCPTGGCPEIPRTSSSTIADLKLTFDYCYTTSTEDQDKIDKYIQDRINDPDNNYEVQEAQIKATLNDSSLHSYFTAEKLEERERAFYEDYFKYHAIRKKCDFINEPNLYIQGDDGYGASYNGFQIRYPINELYENFDPEDPTSIQDNMKDQNCELEAEVMVANFMNNFNCKDLLNPNELKQLEKDIYEIAKKNCEEPLNYNMNQKIEDVLCGYSLPKSCYASALPEPQEGSCECDNIFNFVQDILVSNGGYYNFPEDLYTIPTLADAPSVQNALDIYLTDGSLKPEFSNWFKNCQTNANWYANQDPATYPIDDSFSCDNFGSDEEDTTSEEDCGAEITAYMQHLENIRFEAEIREKAIQFKRDYIEHCLTNAEKKEVFTKKYEFKEYHFTLYYYDQAGNLTQTVAPAGIYQKDTGHNSLLSGQELTNAKNYLYGNSPTFIWPEHVMYTNYQYNSLNAVESQLMPDLGDPNNPITQVTKFYYDALGRLIVSQNPYQVNIDNYSYMLYDELGRTIEAGQVENLTPLPTKTDYLNFLHGNSTSDPFENWLLAGSKNEYTHTYYDEKPISSNLIPTQNHLRNRIAMVSN